MELHKLRPNDGSVKLKKRVGRGNFRTLPLEEEQKDSIAVQDLKKVLF